MGNILCRSIDITETYPNVRVCSKTREVVIGNTVQLNKNTVSCEYEVSPMGVVVKVTDDDSFTTRTLYMFDSKADKDTFIGMVKRAIAELSFIEIVFPLDAKTCYYNKQTSQLYVYNATVDDKLYLESKIKCTFDNGLRESKKIDKDMTMKSLLSFPHERGSIDEYVDVTADGLELLKKLHEGALINFRNIVISDVYANGVINLHDIYDVGKYRPETTIRKVPTSVMMGDDAVRSRKLMCIASAYVVDKSAMRGERVVSVIVNNNRLICVMENHTITVNAIKQLYHHGYLVKAYESDALVTTNGGTPVIITD